MRIFLSSELCPQWQALRTKVQVRFKQLWGGGDSSTKWGHEDGKQKAWGSSRNSWWLQSTGVNPTFQHPLHRCYPLECVESKSGHPKVWAFQPFEGMFPASLMEKTRMQKLLSSSIFSSLFPLNLCLQHFPPFFICLSQMFGKNFSFSRKTWRHAMNHWTQRVLRWVFLGNKAFLRLCNYLPFIGNRAGGGEVLAKGGASIIADTSVGAALWNAFCHIGMGWQMGAPFFRWRIWGRDSGVWSGHFPSYVVFLP